MADLMLRPWDTRRMPVTAHLTVLAPLPALGGRPPGDGQAAPAAVPSDADAATVDGAPITPGQMILFGWGVAATKAEEAA